MVLTDTTERTILDALEIQDPELAEEIKKRMFVFEDIVTLIIVQFNVLFATVKMKILLLSLESFK